MSDIDTYDNPYGKVKTLSDLLAEFILAARQGKPMPWIIVNGYKYVLVEDK